MTYSHAEQYQSWKDTPNTCPIASPPRIFIPQRMYKPHTGSDRRRYVEEVRLSPPIVFEVEHPSEWGIPLDDAIKCRTKRLLEKDALMFEGCGPSVSIRLEVRLHISFEELGWNCNTSSGRAQHGVDRFLPRISGVLQVLSRKPSWPKTSRNVFNGSSRYIIACYFKKYLLTMF